MALSVAGPPTHRLPRRAQSAWAASGGILAARAGFIDERTGCTFGQSPLAEVSAANVRALRMRNICRCSAAQHRQARPSPITAPPWRP